MPASSERARGRCRRAADRTRPARRPLGACRRLGRAEQRSPWLGLLDSGGPRRLRGRGEHAVLRGRPSGCLTRLHRHSLRHPAGRGARRCRSRGHGQSRHVARLGGRCAREPADRAGRKSPRLAPDGHVGELERRHRRVQRLPLCVHRPSKRRRDRRRVAAPHRPEARRRRLPARRFRRPAPRKHRSLGDDRDRRPERDELREAKRRRVGDAHATV